MKIRVIIFFSFTFVVGIAFGRYILVHPASGVQKNLEPIGEISIDKPVQGNQNIPNLNIIKQEGICVQDVETRSIQNVSKKLKSNLIMLVSDPVARQKRPRQVEAAIILLGYFDGPDVVRVLLDLLPYSPLDYPTIRIGSLSKGHKYTAIRALQNHGDVCFPSALQYLKTKTKTNGLHSAKVFISILLKSINAEMGEELLKMAIDEEADSSIRAGLQETYEFYKIVPALAELDSMN